jgi:transposase-like protein
MTIPKLARHSNDVCRLYRDGVSAAAIGRQYNVTTTTVTNLLKKVGLMESRPRGFVNPDTKKAKNKAVEMFNNGSRPSEILREVSISRSCLFKTLSDAGCELRGLDGWRPSEEILVKQAKIKESRGHMTKSEQEVFKLLSAGDYEVTPQMAFGKKNIDFAIHSHSIAIEVFCRTVGRNSINSGELAERIKELGKGGWHVYVLFAYEASSIIDHGIDDMLAWVDFIKRSPAIIREYRMVRCPANLLACGKIESDDISTILSTIKTG